MRSCGVIILKESEENKGKEETKQGRTVGKEEIKENFEDAVKTLERN